MVNNISDTQKLAFANTMRQTTLKLMTVANHISDHQQAVEQMLQIIRQVIPFDGASVSIFVDNALTFPYTLDYPAALVAYLREVRIPITLPNLSKVALSGTAQRVADTHADPDWTVDGEMGWSRSWIGIPIRKSGYVMGVINVDAKTPNHFTQSHLEIANELIEPIALVMEVIHLYETLEDYTSVLSSLSRQTSFMFVPLASFDNLDELCHTIANSIVEQFGKTDCGVMLLNDSGDELIRYVRAGEFEVGADAPLYLSGDGLVVHAVNTGEVVYSPDVREEARYVANEPRTRSELVIPLKTFSRVIGVLDLQSTELDAFNQRDINALGALAEHATMAIENLRLFKQEERQKQVLEERVAERTQELKQSTNRLQAILDHTRDAILLLNPNGVVLQMNRVAAQMFGVRNRQGIELSLFDYLDRADSKALLKQLNNVLSGNTQKSPIATTLPHAGSDTARLPVEIMLAPISEMTAETGEIVCNVRDVSQQRAAQARLQQTIEAERSVSELKTRFIQTVNHEFRTPLAVILSSSELLSDYGDRLKPTRIKEHFAQIKLQVRHLENMMNDVLTMERAITDETPFEPKPVDVRQHCEGLADRLNTAIGDHVIHYHYAGENIPLLSDPDLLEQIIENLVRNAAKYSPGNPNVDFIVINDDNHVALHIIDYGMGIPPDETKNLFQPFFRGWNVSTIQGEGLGLSIVKHAVDKHRGTISVDSELNVGTHVQVMLPHHK